MPLPNSLPIPNAPFVDSATGRLTREGTRFLYSLNRNSGEAVADEVGTPPGSGLQGGGFVVDGIDLSIANGGVTNARLRDSFGFSVIGRSGASTGSPADIIATANDRVLARIGDVVAFHPLSSVPAVVADGNYGDITVSSTGTVWTINNNVVSNAKFRQSGGLSVVGRSASSTGNVADIVGTASQFFGVNAAGTTLGFQTMTGDATLSGPTLTLATVNANTGTWGSATQSAVITLDGKGRATAASNVTITPAASSITGGQALTRTNDTNVTLTLGGAPATALLQATSLTLGWTGILAVARGGTGVSSLGDITRINDTNVTLTLGGTPAGALITSTSFTLGWTGQLAVTRGGTGLGSIAQGDLLYGSASNTIAALAKNTSATRYLSNTGTSNNPSWAQVDLTNGVTGTLPAGNGGTGIAALGTGVATALGVNVGSAGAFVTFNGALGTPSSGTLTNCTGLPNTGVTGLGTMSTQNANAVSLTGTALIDAGSVLGLRLRNGGSNGSAYFGASAAAVPDLQAYNNGGTLLWCFEGGGPFRPGADNAFSLCTAANRSSVVYSATGAINTSDEGEKKWLGDFTDPYRRAAKRIIAEIGLFQWNDSIAEKGDEARLQIGVRAQQVARIMIEEGLEEAPAKGQRPSFRHGFLCYDEWPETKAVPAQYDEDGALVAPAIPARAAGNRYGIRPDQLTMFLMANLLA